MILVQALIIQHYKCMERRVEQLLQLQFFKFPYAKKKDKKFPGSDGIRKIVAYKKVWYY